MTIADQVITQAKPEDRAWLVWLYDQWHGINAEHFAGELAVPVINLEPAVRGFHAYATEAATEAARTEIAIHWLLLPEYGPERAAITLVGAATVRRIGITLAHECVHQWQHEVLGWSWARIADPEQMHGPEFRAKFAEVVDEPLAPSSSVR